MSCTISIVERHDLTPLVGYVHPWVIEAYLTCHGIEAFAIQQLCKTKNEALSFEMFLFRMAERVADQWEEDNVPWNP